MGYLLPIEGAIAGLQHIRIHDLRHAAAPLLLTQGVHPRVVLSKEAADSDGRCSEDPGARYYQTEPKSLN
jgi:hypothetical protein